MRYFFDVQRDGLLARDVDGMDLPKRSKAEEEAMKSLAEMANDLVQVERNRHREGMTIVYQPRLDPRRLSWLLRLLPFSVVSCQLGKITKAT